MGVGTDKISIDTIMAVHREAVAAVEKHGKLTTDLVRACAILGREWAEATNEALMLTVSPQSNTFDPLPGRTRLHNELAQVAATAMLIMEALDR